MRWQDRFIPSQDTFRTGQVGLLLAASLAVPWVASAQVISATTPVAVIAENALPPNGVPDPGETLTVVLPLVNVGANTTNLVATLQATGGVVGPSGPQIYGVVLGGGPSVSRAFTFTAAGTCGSAVVLTLALQDGAVGLGTITYVLPLGTTQTFANATPILIPATGTSGVADPYPSNITVSGLGPISRVTVTVKQFNHTFPDDVDVLLVSPTGQAMILMSDSGGSADAVNREIVFDDAAAIGLPDGAFFASGTFQPTNAGTGDTFAGAPAVPFLSPAPAGTDTLTSAFGGQDPNGTWSLYVVDDVGGDIGNFNGGWEITFTTALCSNAPPLAVDDAFVTSEDFPLLVVAPGLLANDVDANGDPMTIALLTAPTHGVISAINNVTGEFTYVPSPDYHGPDSFTYQLSDLIGLSNVATVSINVIPVNDAPVANPDAYTMDEDGGTLTVPGLTGVLANDTDVDGDSLSSILDSFPASLSFFSFFNATGAFTYTPTANFDGVDSFTYHARDASLDSATVTVAITVNPVNDVPSFTKGADQHVVGGAPTTVGGWATAISSGPPNESTQTLTFLVTNDHPEFFTTQPAVSPTGTLTFNPAPNANGVATVSVRLMDNGGTANGGIDTSAAQTFTIRVVDLIVNAANDVDNGVCNAAHCSLREAMTFANLSPNLGGTPDAIRFAIPGAGVHTIAILSALPAVADPLFINGSTQPGYSTQPLVELNGTSAGLGVAGLRLGAGSSVVFGLAINRFEGHGIEITGPGSNQIFRNVVGTDPTGLLARPNGGSGIRISGSTGNAILENVLSGNGRAGLRLEAGADSNTVEENKIGVGADATTPLPNGENGILILSGSSNFFTENVIAENNTQGVQISAGLHNFIRFNSIHSNGLLGIELGADGPTPNDTGDGDSGANGLQNFPVLTRATTSPTTTGISGTFSGAPNATFTLDYFVSDSCDPSGFGEGASRLDSQNVTTNASGQAVIQISSGFAATTPGTYLTATATSALGDTSEFSACRIIDALPTLVLTGGETAGVLQINEGNPNGGPPTQALTFFVQLSSPSALPVSVNYQTTDGTAQSPSDFLSLSGSLLFAPGETLKQLVVQTVLDNDPETDEAFTLSLGPPSNALPGQSQIQIVLKDDDGAEGPLAISVADVAISEPRAGVRQAQLVVSLSDAAFHTVWVDYHSLNGTALAGTDYTAVSGQLVFQPGDRTKTVLVDVQADGIKEGKETFFLVLTNPEEAILGRGQSTVTIADPGRLFTLTPCRVSDSRLGLGALTAGELRTMTLHGVCGIPATAIAVSANITVAQPVGFGFIEIFPSNLIAPPTSVLNFGGGQTRANNTIIVLSPDGKATVKNISLGTTHLIVDVNGYFE